MLPIVAKHNQLNDSPVRFLVDYRGDGHVRNISQGISQNTFNIALVPNDGLPLPSDW